MNLLHQSARALALGSTSLLILAATAQAAASPNSEADLPSNAFSYTYVQVGAGLVDMKEGSDGEVLEGRAVVGFGRHFYLRGDASHAELSNADDTVTDLAVVLGGHTALTNQIDFTFDAGWGAMNYELGGVDVDFNGPLVGAGVRGFSPERMFEAEARYVYRWMEGDGDAEQHFGDFRAELLWRANDHLAVYAAGRWDKDSNRLAHGLYTAGLRVSL